MTNRQWLEHLSDQELGMFLYSLEDYAHCDICADDGACKATDTNTQNCLGGIIKWLRQEKKGDWVWHASMLEDVDETDETDKTVNPDYYKFHGYDVFDIADYFGLSFPLGNAIKYILRAGKKDKAKEVEDLRKSIVCIRKAISLKERRNDE